ncbi:hypothetical protein F4778DRAFT_404825 [Xylariomycetidae sp. FL2044]|nr:hypothetical protein F4778DRAFT_404825 [Xylariomycetidae sp. FL2044]
MQAEDGVEWKCQICHLAWGYHTCGGGGGGGESNQSTRGGVVSIDRSGGMLADDDAGYGKIVISLAPVGRQKDFDAGLSVVWGVDRGQQLGRIHAGVSSATHPPLFLDIAIPFLDMIYYLFFFRHYDFFLLFVGYRPPLLFGSASFLGFRHILLDNFVLDTKTSSSWISRHFLESYNNIFFSWISRYLLASYDPILFGYFQSFVIISSATIRVFATIRVSLPLSVVITPFLDILTSYHISTILFWICHYFLAYNDLFGYFDTFLDITTFFWTR